MPIVTKSQVGINTLDPQALLDIRSLGNTTSTSALIIRDHLGQPIFNIADDGSISTKGTIKAPVLLDIRAQEGNNIIALGKSHLTYNEAKPGALMYNSSTKSMYVTDDTEWKELSYNYMKAFVVADIPTATQAFPNGSTTIIDWDIVSDPTNSFDTSTMLFTAKREAIYSVSVNITFNDGPVVSNSYIETILSASNGQSVKCITNYHSAGTIPTGAQCSGNFKLAEGENITITLSHNLGNTKYIKVGYCNMDIVEL